MADDMDVDDLLEAPFKKEGSTTVDGSSKVKENGHVSSRDREEKGRDRDRHKEKNRGKDKERDRDRRRRSSSHSKDRHRRSRSRSVERRRRSVSRSKERKLMSHSRDRRFRSRSKDKRRSSRSRSRDRYRRRKTHSRSREKERRRTHSPPRSPVKRRELTAEERDARTVFCMQLSSRIRSRDLEEFFSVVGKVADVRIITDAKTHRSKGIAYVEFEDVESVPLALGLSEQKILQVPIIVQPTQAEKNRIANAIATAESKDIGPMRLYVGSLHFNITEEMLRGIFEPFGKIDLIQLIMDPETNRSKGYAFITYHEAEDAKRALDQLNGFELAGRPMKVNYVTERIEPTQPGSLLDTDEMERAGIDLGATGRLQLMAKLAEGTGMQLPAAAASALNLPNPQHSAAPAVATQCFLLSNMFDPSSEANPVWAQEIKDDVIEECTKHGGVLHVFVDHQSPQGNVYVKCTSLSSAIASVNALHGRWFAGKMITAAYVPLLSYHSLFPDTISLTSPLKPSSAR